MIESIGDWVDKTKINTKYNLFFDIIKHVPNSIYVQVEPEAIIQRKEFLIQNWKMFEYILTFNEEILEKCPNSKKYIFGTSWITPQEYYSINLEEKQFKISMIVGHKTMTKGHQLRKQILNKNFPNVDYYVSNSGVHSEKPLVGSSKFKTFEKYQYQIVIENSQQTNYFTEKLLDCLITKTIPIYWGCPNIHEYFDTSGWIFFTDLEDLKTKMPLNSQYLECKTLESNFLKALEYSNFETNVNNALNKL
jgi:hypothetical protein